MKFQKQINRKIKLFALLFAVLLSLSAIVNAQEAEREQVDNWLYKDGDLYMWQTYRRYSKEDVENAQLKLKEINEDLKEENGEWSGLFESFPYPELGRAEMLFSPTSGFIDYYVYTCLPELRGLDYGDVIDEPNAVWFKSSYSLNSRRSASNPKKYVKVKWGERRLLVSEDDLSVFLKKIVGREKTAKIEDENADSNGISAFVKAGDSEKSISGLPILPDEYAHLLEQPISAKIISVGKKTIKRLENEFNDEPNYESHTLVKINAGSKQNIEVGMAFRIIKTGEFIEIKKVNRQTSIGVIVRQIDESGQESYYDNEAESEKIYPKAAAGWQITTSPEPDSINWY